MKVGIIGCGAISEIYLQNARRFGAVELVAVSDLNPHVAQQRATDHGVEALSVEALLADPAIEVVVNLTIPAAHAEVGKAAIAAGKHHYSEKPLAITLEDSRQLLAAAEARQRRLGCAPDTVLGAGIQTVRALVDEGAIGTPLSGTAMMQQGGPDRWHPNPGFFFRAGGGPMLDMGPYYLTTLVTLLGPVRAVTGTVAKGYAERTCKHPDIAGRRLPVEVPTHFAGVLEFHQGAVVTVVMSFDVFAHRHAPIELYGTEGSLVLPDPNTFGGPVELYRTESSAWEERPVTRPYAENSRILGLVDLIEGIEENRPPRCSGELAHHILEVMLTFEKAALEGRRLELESRPARPAALAEDFRYRERVG